MKKLTIKQLNATLARLKGERGTWETHWQEVSDHVIPRKNTILNKKSEGQKRTWQLLDNVGVHSNELLAGFLHGMLTNPDVPWFELTTGDLDLDSQDDVRTWLQKRQRDIHNVLNNSNFQTEVHELYMDLGSIGTAAMRIEEDEDTFVRFSTKFIADYWIDEDDKGFVNQIFYEYKLTPAQLIKEFGEAKLPAKVMKMFKDGKDEKICCVQAVYPLYLVDPKAGKEEKYISQYIIPDMDHEIESGQFNEFPYVVPRWSKAAGEKYGRSPGMNALPELKVLNKMNETMLIGAQKMVDPPLQLPDDGFIKPLITRPGGINYYRAGTTDMIKPVFNDTRIDFGYQAMEDRRKRVRDSFYVDQLKLQQGGPMMTATEVLQRTEESMRLMGPMLGRMGVEFLSRLINRVYRILVRRGYIKMAEVPQVLQGKNMSVRYSSLIAKSQRVNEGQSIMRLVSAMAPFIQVDPTLAGILNGEKATRILVGTYGAPAEVVLTEKQFAAKKAAAMQAQAQSVQSIQDQQQIDNSLTVAKAVKEVQGLNG